MKTLIKRTLTSTILFSLVVLFFCFQNGLHIKASEEVNELFTVGILVENELDLSSIEIKVNQSVPVYDDNQLVQFDNFYVESYQVGDNFQVTFEKPSDYMLIEINIDTIPEGYGVANKNQFVTPDSNYYQFELYEVSDVNIEIFAEREAVIDLLNNQSEKIYGVYQLDIIEEVIDFENLAELSSYTYTVVVTINEDIYQETYTYDLSDYRLAEKLAFLCQEMIIEDEELDDIIENQIVPLGIFDPGLSYTPSYSNVLCQSSGRYKVYYDGTAMDVTVAQRVINAIIHIDEFFCTTYGYTGPNTNLDGDFYIYIEDGDNISDSSYCYNDKDGLFNRRYSYIVISYDCVMGLYDYASEYSFLEDLASNYFAAIMYKAGVNANKVAEHLWVTASFSQAAAIYYLCENDIIDRYTFLNYFTWVDYYRSSADQTLGIRGGSGYSYGLSLFPLYLIERYGFDMFYEIIDNYNNNKTAYQNINAALVSNYDITLEQFFKAYSINNGYISEGYNNILPTSYTNNWYPVAKYYQVDAFLSPFETKQFALPHMASKYFVLQSNYDCPEPARNNAFITISVDNANKIDLTVITTRNKELYGEKYSYYSTNINTTANSMTFIQNNFGHDICQEVMYILTNYSSTSNLSNIEYTISYQHRLDNLAIGINDVGEHIHTQYLGKFVPADVAMYEFELLINNSGVVSYPEGTIQVLDSNKQIIYRYDLATGKNLAANTEGSNKMTVALTKGLTYYIQVNYTEPYTSVKVKIQIVEREVSLRDSDLITIEEEIDFSDSFTKFVVPISGHYRFNFSYRGTSDSVTNISDTQITYFVFYKTSIGISWKLFRNFSNHVRFDEQEAYFDKGYVLYIGYFNVHDAYGECTINIERIVEQTIILTPDPNANVTVGTEVSLNGGNYGGKTMTVGYTRSIYLMSTAPSISRLDYNWYSFDESIAIVSSYGTVTALKAGTVRIFAIYKGDSTKSGFLTITVSEDESNTLKYVTLTTDQREAPNQYGTEVALMGGTIGETTIHSGYTRFICFASGSPSASIQDFTWTTSNQNIATVSAYGTIIAGNTKGEVTITGVYKYNANFIALITIQVV